MNEFLLLISYPIAWLLFNSELPSRVPDKIFRTVLVVLIVTSGVIIFTPISFLGRTADFGISFVTLIMLFIYALILKKKNGNKVGAIFVFFGKCSLFFLPVLIVLFATNPLYYSYKFDVTGLEPIATTNIKRYRLEHYSKKSNFSYPGNHIIKIKKILVPYFLEMNKGEVNTGRYDAAVNSIIYSMDASSGRTKELRLTLYTVNDTFLIKNKYDMNAKEYKMDVKYRY
jgi:hypothetical protein